MTTEAASPRVRKPRVRKSKGAADGHVAVRIAPADLARVDALLPRYALPGRAATRSDGIRAVILAGLEVLEANPLAAA